MNHTNHSLDNVVIKNILGENKMKEFLQKLIYCNRIYASIFLISLSIKSCTTVTAPGSSVYKRDVYLKGYEETKADGLVKLKFKMVTTPPDVPKKHNTESSMSKEQLHKILEKYQPSGSFNGKTAYVYIAEKKYEFNTTNFKIEITESKKNEIGEEFKQSLLKTNYFQSIQTNLDTDGKKIDEVSGEFDFYFELIKSSDLGDAAFGGGDNDLVKILFSALATIFPYVSSEDNAYYLFLYDKEKNLIGTSAITIKKTLWVWLPIILTPWWWGDSIKSSEYSGNLFIYLAENATKGGFEKITLPDGSKYIGEADGGLPHGRGKKISPDNYIYSGEFANGKYHGNGTLELVDGTKYVGGWNQGVMHGEGVLYMSDGARYSGGFKNGKQSGMGTIYDSNGSVLQRGLYKDGKFVGEFGR